MRKVWAVAVREYRATIKTKTFLIAMGIMPIFMFGSVVSQRVMEGRIDLDVKKIAVLDRSGRMHAPLLEAVERRNREEIIDSDSGKPNKPQYELLDISPEEKSDEQLLSLSEQIRNKELFCFIEIGQGILGENGPSTEPEIRYYSNQPTYRDVRRWLSQVLGEKVKEVRLAEAGIDKAVVAQALRPVGVDNLGLFSRSESGEIVQAEKIDQGRLLIPAIGLILLMWMTLVVTVTPLLNGVLEEKMQRIAEVLLGSASPFDLMLGKLIGYVLVALTLVAIYLIGSYFVADQYGYADVVPFHLLGWFIVFQSLAIIMFGSMFLAAGACCNDMREAQNLVLPIWLPMIIPFFFLGTVLEHPDSLFSVVLSLFPPATPMLMILRMAVPPGVPLWQPLAGIAGTGLTTLVCVWAAGRIFRVGLLLQGKPPKMWQMARWIVRG